MSIITERFESDPRDADRRVTEPPPVGRGARLLWFVGLYAAGVIVTAGVATVLRAILL
jgi:hypothetical protein